MTVGRDQEVSVTARVSLTEDETNEIAAAFHWQWSQVGQEVATLRNCVATEPVALLWSRLRSHLCFIRPGRTIEPAPFEQWFDVGIAPDEILE